MGADETDAEVPISEMAPRPDPGRQYVGRAGGVLQVCDDGGGSRATTTEAGGGADDDRTGLGDADGDGASLAAEAGRGAEVAADWATAEDWRKIVKLREAIKEAKIKAKAIKAKARAKAKSGARYGGGSAVMNPFKIWADRRFGRSGEIFESESDDHKWELELWRSGREADQVRFDWQGGAEGALPDVDRPGPVVATARAEMRDMMDFQAALPVGGAVPASEGDTGGGSGADGVADGAADGGMPTAYEWGPAGRRDRTWPRAEPMMSRRTPGRAVTDFNLPGAPEGSSALPRMWR